MDFKRILVAEKEIMEVRAEKCEIEFLFDCSVVFAPIIK